MYRVTNKVASAVGHAIGGVPYTADDCASWFTMSFWTKLEGITVAGCAWLSLWPVLLLFLGAVLLLEEVPSGFDVGFRDWGKEESSSAGILECFGAWGFSVGVDQVVAW